MNGTIIAATLLLGAPGLKETPKDTPWLGVWQLETTTVGGDPVPPEAESETMELAKDGQFTNMKGKKLAARGKFTLDGAASPMKIEVNFTEARLTLRGIIRVEGDTLTLCLGQGPQSPLPREFASPKGSTEMLFVYKRIKAKD